MEVKKEVPALVAFVINMAMVYVAYMLCRVEYVAENWSALGEPLFANSLTDLLAGSLRFDTSAILYTNILYALMMLFPLHYKETRKWQVAAKWVFVVVNSLAIIANLADSVYFRYTGKRTTMSVLQEFENEGNIGSILGAEILNHWYLFLLGMVMIFCLWKLYVMPSSARKERNNYIVYYVINVLVFALYIPLTIAGMRGGFTHAVRPITISNANQYVSHPKEAAAILNTPFSLIRTTGKKSFKDPGYTQNEIDVNYTALHEGNLQSIPNKKNVVVLIVESFGREYIEEGYAPFVKSLEAKSLSFDYSYANGRKSIDGMPSILSSIPMFIEPFFLTPASMNNVSGLAG
jgi:membrane-anchored protein YejM (alkaline phosphatase superfamily)